MTFFSTRTQGWLEKSIYCTADSVRVDDNYIDMATADTLLGLLPALLMELGSGSIETSGLPLEVCFELSFQPWAVLRLFVFELTSTENIKEYV